MKTIQKMEAEITPGGLGILLMVAGKWNGYSEALDMIDSDAALGLVKQVYHGAVAKQHRTMREPRQKEEMAGLVKVLRRKLKNTGKGVFFCARETLKGRTHSRDRAMTGERGNRDGCEPCSMYLQRECLPARGGPNGG